MDTDSVEGLTEQFSKLGGKIVYQICMKFIDNIKHEYPNTPEKEFAKIMANTLKDSNIQIDAKIQTNKAKIEDRHRCIKMLQSGNNKRCSLSKVEGSDFCKRHRDRVLVTYNKKSSAHQKHAKKYLDIIHSIPHGKPEPLKLKQYKDENIYYEIVTKLVFRKSVDNEYSAYGIYIEGEGIVPLSEDDKKLCEKNSWKYEVMESTT
jgi:hypothetical protein